MRVDLYRAADGELVLDVVLAERNLYALIAKLHQPGSACELRPPTPPPGLEVRVRAETDQVHNRASARREAPPGELHPLTAHIVAAIRVAIAEYVAGRDRSAAGDPTDPRSAEERGSG